MAVDAESENQQSEFKLPPSLLHSFFSRITTETICVNFTKKVNLWGAKIPCHRLCLEKVGFPTP